ncbi:MAG: twin-arginine translocase TatA/TatE family subunit [bacterium]|nr:twin-arginine translocase TatA/TatE family subunit [bacterium]MBU1916519.1 twin-arginine translocase TatA/TatE family subunit [bacterium]
MAMPGPMEIGVIILILAVIFGANRLPKLGEGLGKGIKNFKKGLSGKDEEAKTIEEKTDESPKT